MRSSSLTRLRPRRTILPLLLLLALAAAIPAWAGEGVWTPVGPPGTGSTFMVNHELVPDPFSPSTLYLLDRGENGSGLWKSTNGGGSWTSINAGLGTSLVRSLVADPFTPGTLYILRDESILKSTDGGRTWTEVFPGHPEDGLIFERIVADPAVPGALWSFYSFDGAIYRSTDGGATWTALGSVGGGPVGNLAFDSLNSNVVYFSNQEGLWKSTDRGAHWTEVSGFRGDGFDWIEIAPSRPATLYARPTLGASNPVYPCVRSDDGGLTWTLLPFPEAEDHCDALVVDPENHRRIWVVSTDTRRFYRSQDGGATWTEVNGSLPGLSLFVGESPPLERNPETGIFYLGGPEGVFRSTNGGVTWENVSRGLSQLVAIDLLAVRAGERTPLLGTFLRKPAMRSRNRGRFWKEIPLTAVTALAADPRSPGRILAGATGEGSRPALYESRNTGATWTFLGFTPLSAGLVASIAFPPDRPNAIAIGTSEGGIFQSLNGGRTWRQARAGLRFPPPCDSTVCDPVETLDLTFDPENPQVAHAIFFGNVVRSTNRGFRWRLSQRGLGGNFIVALERDPEHPQVLWAAGGDRLFKTLDGGASWFEISRGIPQDALLGAPFFTDLEFDPRDGGILYAATRNRGIFRSRNGGDTWEPINAGLPLLDVRVLEVDPGTPGGLFAGTGGAGIWAGSF
jgi:photosystem II stability/assembly factor-like uncharacterized protein